MPGKKINIDALYPEILELIKRGHSLQSACKKLGTTYVTFKRNANIAQLKEVQVFIMMNRDWPSIDFEQGLEWSYSRANKSDKPLFKELDELFHNV